MSIFRKGRETVEVWPEVLDVDEFGNKVLRPGNPNTDIPVAVTRCLVQPMTEDADLSAGYRILSMYRVICYRWPSNAKGVARWRGVMYDIVESPAKRDYTPRTSHHTAFLKAREEVKWPSSP